MMENKNNFTGIDENEIYLAPEVTVGLSNICNTIQDKIIQNLLGRFPTEKAHRKAIVVPVVVGLQLLGNVLKRIERMSRIEPFVIFSVMPGCKGADHFCAYQQSI